MKKHEPRTCANCHMTQWVKVRKPNHILHIIMSVLTAGVWLAIYAAAGIESVFARKPKCVECGGKLK